LIGIGGAVLVIVGLLLTLSGLAVSDAFTLILGLVCLAFGVLLLVQAFRHSTTRATT
jgi:energy-converting hydrogenase Eha subunit E